MVVLWEKDVVKSSELVMVAYIREMTSLKLVAEKLSKLMVPTFEPWQARATRSGSIIDKQSISCSRKVQVLMRYLHYCTLRSDLSYISIMYVQ